MDLSKSYEFFKPEECQDRIHIIGCGAIGSTVAVYLARLGLKKIALYDFDYVEPHNIANQMFRQSDIGKSKVQALAEILNEINPDIESELKIVEKGYTGQKLSGYVFLCVDNIDLRREIAQSNRNNPYVKAMFDFRMRLTDAQHYAANWDDKRMIENFLKSMAFSHEEAKEATPVSACNMTLSVFPTVQMIVSCGVSNFMNYLKNKELKKMILIDAFDHSVVAV